MSSEGIRVFAQKNLSKYLYNCIMCKQSESVVRPSTRKIILTDSSLYNVWTYANLKMYDYHVEIEAVVGGRIRDLTRAIMMLYLRNPQRLEIILIAGINNIGEDQSVPDIQEEIDELKTTTHHPVLCQSAQCCMPPNFPPWMSQPASRTGSHQRGLKIRGMTLNV